MNNINFRKKIGNYISKLNTNNIRMLSNIFLNNPSICIRVKNKYYHKIKFVN